MKGLWTGAGLVTGAALGLLMGQLMFDGAWWAPVVGTGVGLIVGAIVDALRSNV